MRSPTSNGGFVMRTNQPARSTSRSLQCDRDAGGDQAQEGPDLRQAVDPDGDDEDRSECQREVGERLPPSVLRHPIFHRAGNEQPPHPADEPRTYQYSGREPDFSPRHGLEHGNPL